MPANPALKAPQPPPLWTHTSESVLSETKAAIEAARKVHDSIAAIPHDQCTFESVVVPLAHVESDLAMAEPLSFYQNVSPSQELRDASNKAEILFREFAIETEMRVDLYEALKAADAHIKATGQKLSPEEARLVEKMLLDGKRAGLGLSEKDREKLTELKKELSAVCVEFGKNYNEEKGSIAFTLEELKGVPKDVISGYTKRPGATPAEDLYEVTYKTPDIFPVFKNAENPETRRRAHEGYESRLAINVPLLSRALELRSQCAALLGYETWADYGVEDKMIKTSKAVFEFLDDLQTKLKPVGEKDRATLLALKKEEHERLGLPFDGEFYIHDYRYYDRLYVERTLSLNESLVKEYFPVEVVVPVILDIYQGLLGVRFEKIEGEVWHPDVQQFAVWEADAKDESGFVGYTFLDLFPREAKYGHAAVWGLIPSFIKRDGGQNYPVTAMVANLAKSTPERKALMKHDDVVTFFHEMGHVFHGILSRTKFARFHGTSVARDFVEAPSQMLENWCWEPEVLQKMSSHFERQEPLSKELIDKIIQSRYVNIGLYFLRQVFFAKFDIKVHSDKDAGKADYTALWNNLREEISLVKTVNPTPGQGTFAHITGGYDAGYYSYAYSLVFAADMYETVFKKNPLDPALGKLYRDKILLPGGSRDELDSLKDFLGRAPNSDAFLKNIFGSAPKSSDA